ncbi:MAG: hypothetical protein J0626_07290, partial [Rhodospirillaceae bacterium]|nr:hypothetical protein [Rhodospirillaceae bacterium]
MAVGQHFQIVGTIAQIVTGAALRNHQAQHFLVDQRSGRVGLGQIAAQYAVQLGEIAPVPDP